MGRVPTSPDVRHHAHVGGLIRSTATDVLLGLLILGAAALSGLVVGGVALGPGYLTYAIFAALSGSSEDNFAAVAPWIVGIIGTLVAAGVIGHNCTRRDS